MTTSTWPSDAAARTLDVVDEFVDPEADRSWPVLHDGELLGGVSLAKEHGETITAAEATLLADLAAGLGLALRNTRLTGELRRQVAELEASRERVLTAADAARRDLEHALDSGPQQQLVALKVKLGPTRKRAEQLAAGEKDILEKIASNGPLSEVLDVVAQTVEQVTGRARCAILLIDNDQEHLAVGSAPNLPEKLIDAMDSLPVSALTAAPAPSPRVSVGADRVLQVTLISVLVVQLVLGAIQRHMAYSRGGWEIRS